MGATGYEIIGVKKYIKIPDRRLISGFLTINIINHNTYTPSPNPNPNNKYNTIDHE